MIGAPFNLHAPMSETFIYSRDVPWKSAEPGLRRQILGHGADLMMVRVDFDAGAVGALHHHPHRQVAYVVSGRFEVTVDGEKKELGVGDCFFIAADQVHGVLAKEAGTLIDAFTPARADFLASSPDS